MGVEALADFMVGVEALAGFMVGVEAAMAAEAVGMGAEAVAVGIGKPRAFGMILS
jgi:hypothetical protein